MKSYGFGRFVQDPVLKDAGGTKVCDFTLAVNEFRRINGERKKITHYFDFVIWDKAAELIVQYKRKGDLLFFEATARQDKWQDSEGKTRSKVIFRVDEFSFLPTSNRRNDESNDDVSTSVEHETEQVEEEEEVPF